MDGLLIREPWVNYILSGKKIWEIRGSATTKRGRIALIKSKSGLILGTADLVDCIYLTPGEYRNSSGKHAVEYEDTAIYPYKKTYAWVFENPRAFKKPIPYKHPNGAVIWVKLNNL